MQDPEASAREPSGGAALRGSESGRGVLKPLAFSTMDFPPESQFLSWLEQHRAFLEVAPLTDPSGGYPAQYRLWSFGHFALSTGQAPPAIFRRTQAHVRRNPLDLWQIHVPHRGRLRLRTDIDEVTVTEGVPYIVPLDQPFEGERDELEWNCLFVSRDAFPSLGPTIDACRHAPLTGAMGGLLAHYVQSLADSLQTMTEAELPRAAEATRALIAACVAPQAPLAPDMEAHVERARLGRIRQIIRQNLRSSRLGPGRLCKLAGVSRSQLYRLFEPFGGVARYIQSERLRQAHQALADPLNTSEIIKVAEDFGFFDPSAFSRAFRREFDYSPTQLRQTAQSSWVAAPIRKAAGPQAIRDFASALRQI